MWKPFESAPDDGRPFLSLWTPDDEPRRTMWDRPMALWIVEGAPLRGAERPRLWRDMPPGPGEEEPLVKFEMVGARLIGRTYERKLKRKYVITQQGDSGEWYDKWKLTGWDLGAKNDGLVESIGTLRECLAVCEADARERKEDDG